VLGSLYDRTLADRLLGSTSEEVIKRASAPPSVGRDAAEHDLRRRGDHEARWLGPGGSHGCAAPPGNGYVDTSVGRHFGGSTPWWVDVSLPPHDSRLTGRSHRCRRPSPRGSVMILATERTFELVSGCEVAKVDLTYAEGSRHGTARRSRSSCPRQASPR
jgi:hypothetical protein